MIEEDLHRDIRNTLKKHGLRYSRARESILEFFREKGGHVGAEEIYLALRQGNRVVSLSTVYLNLNALCEAGLIRRFRGENGKTLYDGNVEPHYHVICKETGEIIDLPALRVEGLPLGLYLKHRIEAATGWQVDEPTLELRGLSPGAHRQNPKTHRQRDGD